MSVELEISIEYHCFMGWRPVATVPIDNLLVKHVIVDTRQALDHIRQLYPVHDFRYLKGFEYAARLDGIYLVRFWLDEEKILDYLSNSQITSGEQINWRDRTVSSIGRSLGIVILRELKYVGDFNVAAPLFERNRESFSNISKYLRGLAGRCYSKFELVAAKKTGSRSLDVIYKPLSWTSWCLFHIFDFCASLILRADDRWPMANTRWLRFIRYFRGLLSENPHSRSFLTLDPVQVADSSESGTDRMNDNSGSIVDLSTIVMDDAAIARLRALHPQGKTSNRFACLWLREICARKRELCIRTMGLISKRPGYRYFNWIFLAAAPIIMLLVYSISVGAFAVLNWILSMFGIASIGSQALFISVLAIPLFYGLYDIGRRRRPILRVVRHTIGFFEYVNVYSSIVESIYKNHPPKLGLQSNTGGFRATCRSLHVRYEGERLKLQTKRDLIILIFTSIAAVGAIGGLYKLSLVSGNF